MNTELHLVGRRIGGITTVSGNVWGDETFIVCGIEGEAKCSLQFRAEREVAEHMGTEDDGMGMDDGAGMVQLVTVAEVPHAGSVTALSSSADQVTRLIDHARCRLAAAAMTAATAAAAAAAASSVAATLADRYRERQRPRPGDDIQHGSRRPGGETGRDARSRLGRSAGCGGGVQLDNDRGARRVRHAARDGPPTVSGGRHGQDQGQG